MRQLPLILAAMICITRLSAATSITLTELPEDGREGFAEIRGVSAGTFDPEKWRTGTLNWVPEVRHPLIEPLPGKARNIYAPSAVKIESGWRVFYGAWDGVPTGNDRIYSVRTQDFLGFEDRHTVIEHGVFQHVCNVSALRLPSGAFSLMCTAYPDQHGLNKPAFFSSSDGQTWNGTPAPYPAEMSDIISIAGYDKYEAADINGMNVILHEAGSYRLYFCNFRDFGKIYRASGTDGKMFQFEGVALPVHGMVNDVKKFATRSGPAYLMGIHANTDRLWYSTSGDGMKFETSTPLFRHLDENDRHIVAIGWVVDGEQEKPGGRVLGVLYGAGAVPSLDRNRIFARWLQKQVTWSGDEAGSAAAARSLGPDRQLLPLRNAQSGKLVILDETGVRLGETTATLEPGKAYQLTFNKI